VTDYLSWRGIVVDGDTRRLIRRTIEVAGEIRSVTALSRSLYLSRRALGRRFLSRGLPVPSHWLHVGRILRATLRLQGTDETLFTIACDLGYPDGFALSNQMYRLTGIRPTTARECLGWEWVLESWLRREAEAGGLVPDLALLQPKTKSPARSERPLKRPRVDRRSVAG
jgi:AraC-like DNA-binding protein